MSLQVEDDVFLPVILIDNGRLLDKNLRKMGLDRKWLDKQLKAHKVHRVEDVFLHGNRAAQVAGRGGTGNA